MKIGYAKVSTHDQNLDLQINALQAAGCGVKISGFTIVRLELQKILT